MKETKENPECQKTEIWKRRTDNMEFLANTIISGIIYDLSKKVMKLSYQEVFGRFFGEQMRLNASVYNEFLDEINQKRTLQEKEEIVNKRLESGTLAFEQELYNTEFAKRLDYIILLINQANAYENKINLEFLAENLDFPSVDELKCYYTENKEPDFAFIEELADKLGVNATWLKTGINATPFLSTIRREDREQQLLKNEIEGKYTFVIKDFTQRPEILLLKRVNDIKYVLFQKPFVFNSNVGSAGSEELYLLYRFLSKLYKRNELSLSDVYFVPEDIFYKMKEGTVYPGIMRNYPAGKRRGVLCDFIDIEHSFWTMEECKEIYGEDFLKIQEIVKRKCNRKVNI